MQSPKDLFKKLQNIDNLPASCSYTLEKCERIFPLISKINHLKKEKNAIILAHSYVHPDIIYGVSDFVGDSYELAKKGMETDAEVIVFPSVRFMVESAKILSPEKTVIDPNPNGGCSLADSITAEKVLALRQEYPDYAFFCYINTTAEVKAVCDVVVTSSNVYSIVEKYPSDCIYFLPDQLMGENVRAYLEKQGIQKKLKIYPGSCYVHEQYSSQDISHVRKVYPKAKVIAHPECSPEVVSSADVIGSTSKMVEVVKKDDGKSQFLLLTECGIASRLQSEFPKARLVGSCNLCKYMRSNSLQSLLQALENPKPSQVIELGEEIRKKAVTALQAMFYYNDLPKRPSLN